MAQKTNNTYTLKYPLSFGDDEIKTITIPERFKGKHLRAMDRAEGEVGKVIELLAELAQVPSKVVDEIDTEDLTELSNLIGERLGKSPGTGRT